MSYEIATDEDLIVDKSGMKPARVARFIDLLFQSIDGVPASEFSNSLSARLHNELAQF